MTFALTPITPRSAKAGHPHLLANEQMRNYCDAVLINAEVRGCATAFDRWYCDVAKNLKAADFVRRHTLRPPVGWRNPLQRKEQ